MTLFYLQSYRIKLLRTLLKLLAMAIFRSKHGFSLMVILIPTICDAIIRAFVVVMKTILLVAVTCILALGGSVLGTTMGAIRGQFTEAGFLDGAGKGAVTGAIAAIQLLELDFSDDDDDESFPKVALLGRMVLGKSFMECIYLTVAKAYEWNMFTETTSEHTSDAYDSCRVTGLADHLIKNLPIYRFNEINMSRSYNDFCCSICIQELKDGELTRVFPKCRHWFHQKCIDVWLTRRGSCPMCRTVIFNEINN